MNNYNTYIFYSVCCAWHLQNTKLTVCFCLPLVNRPRLVLHLMQSLPQVSQPRRLEVFSTPRGPRGLELKRSSANQIAFGPQNKRRDKNKDQRAGTRAHCYDEKRPTRVLACVCVCKSSSMPPRRVVQACRVGV